MYTYRGEGRRRENRRFLVRFSTHASTRACRIPACQATEVTHRCIHAGFFTSRYDDTSKRFILHDSAISPVQQQRRRPSDVQKNAPLNIYRVLSCLSAPYHVSRASRASSPSPFTGATSHRGRSETLPMSIGKVFQTEGAQSGRRSLSYRGT